MNYGETLTYWYFRLNGFFPVMDFVLHGENGTASRSADCDLLAIRHPHVYEDVGGRHDDWDIKFNELGIDLRNKIVGAIIEVKTGEYTASTHRNIETSFSGRRLKYAINRFGFWPQPESEDISHRLQTLPHIVHDRYCILKLAIADAPQNREHPYWHLMTLEEVDAFIFRRFEFYQQKFPDRHFFPSDLMQYMIWKSARQQHR